MNKEMQALIDAPLANPLAINLPKGRRPAPRSGKPVYADEFAPVALTAKQLRARQEAQFSSKMCSLLDYYADTQVPFERIAEHVKLPVDRVAAAMAERGRAA